MAEYLMLVVNNTSNIQLKRFVINQRSKANDWKSKLLIKINRNITVGYI